MKNDNRWIPVCDHVADVMPTEDCEVWVTRWGLCGRVWVQKINYYKENKLFDWDGIIAWMPLIKIKPKCYKPTVANPEYLVFED